MYEKLLLHRDGGIIDASQQYEQDNCAVLAIGLGGTGVDCLKNLKTKVYNRLKPDNPHSTSGIPEYCHIKFLAVDTDKTGLSNANNKAGLISRIDLDTEFFDISHSGDMTKVFEANRNTLEGDPAYKEWLEHDRIKVKVAAFGAGGVRQLGRYLFMEKARAFTDEVCSKVKRAMSGLNEPEVYVHIFFGISGGTGAGVFLDACYLVRHCLSELSISANICGYFFLPDVNLAKPGMDNEAASYIKVNGYASMQEFDYCTNFERNGDKWSQYYPGIGMVESVSPPVDIAHLITAQDSTGNIIDDAYNYSMNVVTDYFMEFVAKTSEDFTLKSHISNYVSKKEEINKKHGAMYEYCALGAASATLPFKEVLTYLTSKMFGGFEGVRDNLPAKSDFEEFVKKNALGYTAIENQLKTGVNMAFTLPDIHWKDALSDDLLTVDYFKKECLSKAETVLTKNFDTLTKEIKSYSETANGSNNSQNSIISRIFSVLKAIMIDIDKGPYYACAILRHTLGGDLIGLFSSYIEQARLRLQGELVLQDKLDEERIAAGDDFINGRTTALNGKKRYQKYCIAVREYYLLQLRISFYSKTLDLMECVKSQLNKLANDFVDVFRDVITNLINTFSSNYNYLLSISDKTASYEFPIAKISDLEESLDRTINSMEAGEKMSEFLSKMLDDENISLWITGNENGIVMLVTEYFTKLFSDNSKKTMTQYLRDKYKTTDSMQLTKSIREDIMQSLDEKSSPLFWTADMYDINSASQVGFVSVPSQSSEVLLSAKMLSEKDTSLSVRASDINDRITIMRCLVGVPLYGYQGLLQYENRSVESPKIGKHLYEGRQYHDDDTHLVSGRNWHLLPSPSPLSVMNSFNNESLKKSAQEAKLLYEKAEEKGIIKQKESGKAYFIRTIKPEYFTKAKSLYERAVDYNLSKQARFESYEALKSLPSIFDDEEIYEIENDGYAELPERNKRDVRIDHFAAAPVYGEIASEQLYILETIDNFIEKSKPREDNDFDDFSTLVFCGIITVDNAFIKYSDTLTLEDVFLSKPSMPLGAVPLYQALGNYRGISDSEKNALKNAATALLDEYPIPQKISITAERIQNELSPTVLKRRLDALSSLNPSESQKARQVLIELKEKLSSFMSTFLNR